MYIFDTSSFIEMSKFYPNRFKTLWSNIDECVKNGKIISCHEVFKEIQDRFDIVSDWRDKNLGIFHKPSSEEAQLVTQIFTVKNGHFQTALKREQLLKGLPFADPFVVASTKIKGGIVVTQEKYKENGTKIPNVCEIFSVPCLNFEGFMEKENWEF